MASQPTLYLLGREYYIRKGIDTEYTTQKGKNIFIKAHAHTLPSKISKSHCMYLNAVHKTIITTKDEVITSTLLHSTIWSTTQNLLEVYLSPCMLH